MSRDVADVFAGLKPLSRLNRPMEMIWQITPNWFAANKLSIFNQWGQTIIGSVGLSYNLPTSFLGAVWRTTRVAGVNAWVFAARDGASLWGRP